MARFSYCGFALLLAVGASGCLDFSDNRGAVMSIELCWDEDPGDAFTGKNCVNSNKGTCERAGVSSMVWSLTNAETGKKVAGSSEDCANGIDVLEPDPGRYTLNITGESKDQSVSWQGTCKSLDVLRFDISYECDVASP